MSSINKNNKKENKKALQTKDQWMVPQIEENEVKIERNTMGETSEWER